MKLGVLSRTGVVLTTAWLTVGSFVLAGIDLNTREKAWVRGSTACRTTIQMPDATQFCNQLWGASPRTDDIAVLRDWLIMTAVGAGLAWLLGLAVYWSIRWIRAGRQNARGR